MIPGGRMDLIVTLAAFGAGAVLIVAALWLAYGAGQDAAEDAQERREDATREAIEGAERPDTPGAALRWLCDHGQWTGDLCE